MVILFVALLLRLVYFWQIHQSDLAKVLLGDARIYDSWASEIASGRWLGDKVFYQAPLYPYFLGLTYAIGGHHLFIVRIAQCILGAFSCVFMGKAASQFFSPSVGIVTAILMALCPTLLFFDLLIQKAVLDVFFFSLVWLLCAKATQNPCLLRWWFGLGCAIGLLALTRENALLILPLFMLWAWHYYRARVAALILTGTACILLPIAFRNAMVGGGFQLTTSQMGPNFYIGNNEHADGSYQPLLPRRGDARYERTDAVELAENELGRALTPGEVSRFWMAKSLAFIEANPVHWARLLTRKWFLVWNAVELPDTEEQSVYAEHSPMLRWLSVVLHFGVLCPLAAAGVVWSHRRPSIWLWIAAALVYAASVTVFYVFARYRLLLYPLVIVFASVTLVDLRERLRRPLTRSTCGGLVALVIGAVFVNWRPSVGYIEGVITWTNLGNEFSFQGDHRRAIEWYDRALAAYPESDEGHANKGVALGKLGEFAAAADQLTLALSINPTFPNAEMHLGNALVATGCPQDSLPHFEQARIQRPRSAEVFYNLGTAKLQLRLPEEAVLSYEKAIELEPDFVDTYNNLGALLIQLGRVDEAIPHLRTYAEFRPNAIAAHANLGVVLRMRGAHDEAAREYERALQIDAEHLATLGNLAWLLATSPNPSVRNGARAVQLALKANAIAKSSDPIILRSLAAAYAEAGNFDAARKAIQAAIQLLNHHGDHQSATVLGHELESYNLEKPYRE